MKNIIKGFVTVLLVSILLTGCNEQEVAPIVEYDAPTVTFTTDSGLSSFTVDESAIEDGETFVVNVTTSKPLPLVSYIEFTQTGGTANGLDFETHAIKIEPYTTSGSGSITILKTGDIDIPS